MTALVSEGLVNCMNLSLSLFPSSMFAVIIVIACLVRSDSFWIMVLVKKSKRLCGSLGLPGLLARPTLDPPNLGGRTSASHGPWLLVGLSHTFFLIILVFF